MLAEAYERLGRSQDAARERARAAQGLTRTLPPPSPNGDSAICARLMKPVKAIHTLYVAVTLSAATFSAPTKTAPPDVFLITIDTLRADHVHCYGYNNGATPALDALAKDGVRFTQAFTPSPITNTSHASILTGLCRARTE